MSRPLKSDLDCGGKSRVRNLPAPSDPGDAVNLDYLDNLVAARDAYAIAVANGFVGTKEEWLASLIGPAGPPGSTSLTGLVDVDATHKVDGSVLTYDAQSEKFVVGGISTTSTLTDGGNF